MAGTVLPARPVSNLRHPTFLPRGDERSSVLLSMTGFGNAAQQSEQAYVSVELKAVNNRYLKLSMRLPDMVVRFESDIEKLIRDAIARGSVQLSFRVRLNSGAKG